jgi:hypothetical protein
MSAMSNLNFLTTAHVSHVKFAFTFLDHTCTPHVMWTCVSAVIYFPYILLSYSHLVCKLFSSRIRFDTHNCSLCLWQKLTYVLWNKIYWIQTGGDQLLEHDHHSSHLIENNFWEFTNSKHPDANVFDHDTFQKWWKSNIVTLDFAPFDFLTSAPCHSLFTNYSVLVLHTSPFYRVRNK